VTKKNKKNKIEPKKKIKIKIKNDPINKKLKRKRRPISSPIQIRM